jgi:hypothetical protein
MQKRRKNDVISLEMKNLGQKSCADLPAFFG